MARTITAALGLTVNVQDQDVVNALVKSKVSFDINLQQSLSAGDGSSDPLTINEAYADQRTLAGGANEELDLSGTLVGPHGVTVAFTKVKALIVYLPNITVQASGIIVGGAAAAGFIAPFGDATDKIKVKKGGFLVLATGQDVAAWAVAAGASDKLKIENQDGAVVATYQIVILGNKA